MCKTVILSDTHNNQSILKEVFLHESGYTHIIHLGDDYEDLDETPELTVNALLVRVPGIFHKGYLTKTIPNIRGFKIGKWKIAITHRLEDFSNLNSHYDIYLYGHTHHPLYQRIGSRHFINPGHLKDHTDRGTKASYATMKIQGNQIELEFKHLDGITFNRKILNNK
ncbi:MAG: metallophosphoesterase family protein [Candidatus Cloacimonetes bacterium]|nr:metallophosphoesterase family protein [Candidatus Cloacimonadota bacterium]